MSIKPDSPTAPPLDSRTQEDLFQQCSQLARLLTPDWTSAWGPELEGPYSEDDPGVAMFRLFSNLGSYFIRQLNQVGNQRKLAFLRFFGIVQRPPWSAGVLLSFTHSPGTGSAVLPAGTRVQYVAPEQVEIEESVLSATETADQTLSVALANRQILFQTTLELKVVPAVLDAVYSLEPSQDRYRDQSPPAEEPPTGTWTYDVFGQQPMVADDHLFLIGDRVLFAPQDGIEGLTLILRGENLIPAWFDLWYDGKGTPLETRIEADADGCRLKVFFLDLPKDLEMGSWQAAKDAALGLDPAADTEAPEETEEVSEENAYWFSVQPLPGLPVLPDQGPLLPWLDEIGCEINSASVLPDATFAGETELDIKNGAQPFGETPQKEDSFYIGSMAVLGKTGARVRIDFSLETILTPPDQKVSAILAWEYWNGENWIALGSPGQNLDFVDRSNNFYGDNPEGGTYISFICPDIPQTEVGGLENNWIRARIAAGNYGRGYDYRPKSNFQVVMEIPDEIMPLPQKLALILELDADPGFNFGYIISDSQYYPPFIRSLHLAYSFEASPARAVAYNFFRAETNFHQPYQPMPGYNSAFLMGFALEGFGSYTVGGPLNLYFQRERQRAVSLDLNKTLEEAAQITWSYYDGSDWKALKVQDQSAGLLRSGLVVLDLPGSMKPGEFFGKQRYWLRIENGNINRRKPLVMNGILPNSIPAENQETIRNEILGSGNGEPDQTFFFSQPLILKGQQIEVLEPSFPSREEIAFAESQKRKLEVRTIVVPGQANLYAVVWTEVDSFALSTPLSRHYTINRQTGEVIFGDGVRGMTVPFGADNVIVTLYNTCVGERGNVPAGTLIAMEETIPQVTAVFNPSPASMGRDGDSDESVVQVGPWEMRNRNLAVLREDFEQLAIQADTAVSKASAVVKANGSIHIHVFSHEDRQQDRQIPLPEVLDNVASYIRARMLFLLEDRLRVLPPSFLLIDILVQVVVLSGSPGEAEENINKTLSSYFNLSTGGPDNKGWEFAEDIHVEDIREILSNQTTKVVSLTANGQTTLVQLQIDQLPLKGQVMVLFVDEEARFGN